VFWKEHEGQDFDDIDIDMRIYHESAGTDDQDIFI
jgi:hypothetical protein